MEYRGTKKRGHDHEGLKIMEYRDTEKASHDHEGREIMEYPGTEKVTIMRVREHGVPHPWGTHEHNKH